jgi:hypothetical protein
LFYVLVAAMVVVYLCAAEGAKYFFYRYLAGGKTGARTLKAERAA